MFHIILLTDHPCSIYGKSARVEFVEQYGIQTQPRRREHQELNRPEHHMEPSVLTSFREISQTASDTPPTAELQTKVWSVERLLDEGRGRPCRWHCRQLRRTAGTTESLWCKYSNISESFRWCSSYLWNAERVMHYVVYFYAVSFDAVVSFDVVVSFDADGAVHEICFMSFTLYDWQRITSRRMEIMISDICCGPRARRL